MEHSTRFIYAVLSGLLALLPYLPCFAATTIYYPRAESNDDQRSSYPIALLTLCLSKTHSQYELHPTPFHMQQERGIRMLESGNSVDVIWTVTSKEREQQLLAIPIPIDKGLIGWRLLLVHESNLANFEHIKSAQALARLRAGQGHDWPDYKVMLNNQFLISPSVTYTGLFKMLATKHIDYIPRSINEIWPEAETHKHEKIVVEPNIIIQYPEAIYFFVNKNNIALANDIREGLNTAIQDGSFKTLFDQYFFESIQKTQLKNRTIIRLNNTELPLTAPSTQSPYWLSEGDLY